MFAAPFWKQLWRSNESHLWNAEFWPDYAYQVTFWYRTFGHQGNYVICITFCIFIPPKIIVRSSSWNVNMELGLEYIYTTGKFSCHSYKPIFIWSSLFNQLIVSLFTELPHSFQLVFLAKCHVKMMNVPHCSVERSLLNESVTIYWFSQFHSTFQIHVDCNYWIALEMDTELSYS